jgi:putative DNA primase/helicase
VKGTDHAIWRRLILVPFAVTIPAEERDGQLGEKLLAEAPGILRWMVEGCVEWQAGGLRPPEEILAAGQAYREDMDVLADFLREVCVKDGSAKTPVADLYGAYQRWCNRNHEVLEPKRTFADRLEEKGFKGVRATNGVRVRLGLRLKPTEALFARMFEAQQPALTADELAAADAEWEGTAAAPDDDEGGDTPLH